MEIDETTLQEILEENIGISIKNTIKEILEDDLIVDNDYEELEELYCMGEFPFIKENYEGKCCATCGINWKEDKLVICGDDEFRCRECKDAMYEDILNNY